MPFPPGTRLGPYEISASIGAGGMGEVYRGRDATLNRDVAIKVLPAAMASDTERLARFKREAQVLASLNHPNIAHIYGFEAATLPDGSTMHFLAMEMVEGEDLSERLRRGAIPVQEAIVIAKQIAEGLEEAHERGIVHRDLKPANVKVTPDGKVKVLDFGLAKALEGDPSISASHPQLSHSPTMSRHTTDAGMIMGTAAYMSPEQARGKAADKRADIWAFGVVLYEMLTGNRLFAGETVSDVLAAVLKSEVNLGALPATTTPRLRTLIRDCLVRDPKGRLRDIGDARLALDRVLIAPSGRAAARPEARRWGPWVAGTLGVAALLAGFGLGRGSAPARTAPSFAQRTFATQLIFNARFMPDGRTLIVSSALTGSTPSLFELRPESAMPRPFGPVGTHLLSVSKTGELAVLTGARYIAQRLMSGTLARMSADSAPRPVTDGVREADWLPDGSDLAVVRDGKDHDRIEFPIGKVVYQAPGYLSDPRVSPDGTRLAFMEHPGRWDDRGFVKVVNRMGAVVTLSDEFSSLEGLAWSPDSHSVLFSGSKGILQVFQVSASGGASPRAIVSSAGDLQVLDIAPDGTLAVARETWSSGIVARGTGQDAEHDLGTFDQSWSAALSHDGRFVAFSDGRGESHDYTVFLRNVDGSPPSRLGEGNVSSVSRDDRWVAATLLSTGRCVVYPTGAGAPVPVVLGSLETCQAAIFFPDGKSLAIVANEKGKPARAYRASFPGGAPTPLLPEGLSLRRISESGRRLLAQDRDAAFHVFDIGGVSAPVKGLLPDDRLIEWSSDEKSVIVSGLATMPAVLERVVLNTGGRTRVGEVGPKDAAGVITVRVEAYRENGRLYAYQYNRIASALFLVDRGR